MVSFWNRQISQPIEFNMNHKAERTFKHEIPEFRHKLINARNNMLNQDSGVQKPLWERFA